MLSLYEILKASKTGIAPDMWTALAGKNWGGAGSGAETKEITGIPPLSIRSNGTMLLDYLISGNMSQTGTPTPTTPIQPQETGERTGNLFDKDNADIADLYPDAATREIKQSSNLSTWSIVLPVEPSTTYTFTMGEATTAIRRRVGMCSDYPTKGAYCTSVDDTPEYDHPNLGNIFTTDADTRYVLIMYVSGAGRDVAIERANRVQVVKGNTALPYEPYGYKISISSGGENLAPPLTEWVAGYVDASGNIHNPSGIVQEKSSDFIKITPSKYYTFSFESGTFPTGVSGYWSAVGIYDENKTFIRRDTGEQTGEPRTFYTNANAAYIRLSYRSYGSELNTMLNLGSEALPYEPYNRTTTPIYLGEVPTTRRIQKLVLTGKEANWTKSLRFHGSFYNAIIDTPVNTIPILCSHAVYTSEINETAYVYGKCCVDGSGYKRNLNLYIGESSWTVDEFKAYLAQQYANGTPVCVWYVLATPKTSVVNEPLRKIGNYADTVSYEQAGVQIPTLHGNTVIDVETELKPSEMYIKYKG